MRDFFDWVVEFFTVTLWDWLRGLGEWLLGKALTAFGNMVLWALDLLESGIEAATDGVDYLADMSATWDAMPQNVIYVAGLMNVPEAVGIIIAALLARLAVRLVILVTPGLG